MIGILCVALCCLFLKDAAAATTINAVVFEGRPDPNNNIKTNLETYKKSLSLLDNPNFIVFPEYGLTGYHIDDLGSVSTAISDKIASNDNLTALNDLAKAKKAYVVASLIEKDGDDFYSTTVVVNGSDNLVAKYRKINTNSTEKNLKSGSDITVFQTEKFGKIGLISGDDILYEKPSQTILKGDNNATTVIYTAAFRSLAPFKTALSIQQGYAQANGINLLAANLNDPKNGTGGSGVYSQNKVVSSYINAAVGTQKLKVQLPVLDKRTTCQKVQTFNGVFDTFNTVLVQKGTDQDISNFNLSYVPDEWVVKNVSKDFNDELCDGSFCCTFNIKANWNNKNEMYRVIVRKGDNGLCALIQCNSTGGDCGTRRDDLKTTFTVIEIVQKDTDRTYRPYTLLNTLYPIDPVQTYFCQNDTVNLNITASKNPVSNLIAFGIITTSGASSFSIMYIQVTFMVVILQFFFKST